MALDHRSFPTSDHRMPKVGGLDLLQHIKEKYPELPVVLMTAYAHEQEVDTAITEGVFAVLRKPFDFDEALLALTRALSGHAVLVVDDGSLPTYIELSSTKASDNPVTFVAPPLLTVVHESAPEPSVFST